ncbi:MAG: 4-alpha-glucanotransferase, partial [Bacteroides sp.]
DTTMTHTWTDSYPYNSISIYAFHPMYTNLQQLGKLKDKKALATFAKQQKELNNLPAIDYEAVNQLKWNYFELIFKQEGEKVLASEEFKTFFESNKEWLQPYAVFSHMRDVYKTPDFRKWPQYTIYNAEEIEKLCQPQAADYSSIAIYFYIQFNLHLQLMAATKYARDNGVVLKGDIPIGISRNSVEAWTEPHYFNLNGQAGAPPDDFSVNGQNWGFPTYNWEMMEKDGYAWWMKRFHKMSEYFDAYRIDHILGFFRIWEIPMNAVHGLLGQFVPALPMSKMEIESYGLSFRDEFLKPYIHEYFLEQVFGSHTDYVKETFIEPTDTWEVYRMRSEFDTQRKVEAYFADKTDEESSRIKEGLYSLISDVLFVPDHKEPHKFHPRIGVQHDFIYRSLNEWEKTAFNRLYDQYYYHRHNEFWHQQAMKKLPQLTQSTRMLVCGEDLGMIPECVAWVMNDLRILSLEIQRMPKNPTYEFGHLNEYPYRSVCTISTHDMSTLRGWWEEDYQQTQRYYNSMLGRHGNAPSVATAELCEEVVRNHLYSNSILCILAWQDWLSIDETWRNPNVQEERINVPSNPRHYWRYRMHLTLEELLKAEGLNNKIKELVNQTGRKPLKSDKENR